MFVHYHQSVPPEPRRFTCVVTPKDCLGGMMLSLLHLLLLGYGFQRLIWLSPLLGSSPGLVLHLVLAPHCTAASQLMFWHLCGFDGDEMGSCRVW